MANEEAVKYVSGILASLWARYWFPPLRFGYLTSNIAESANSIHKDARDPPVLQMLIVLKNSAVTPIPYVCISYVQWDGLDMW
jgi:hypothetical protein